MGKEDMILELLTKLSADVSDLKTDVAGLKTDVAELKTDVANLKSVQEEQGVWLSKLAMKEEHYVIPRLDALAEGQKNLLNTLAPKARVAALEDDTSLLKLSIKMLADRVSVLEKAQ